jgi:nicotinate phosphoribosyltransferase
VITNGRITSDRPGISDMRKRREQDIESLDPGVCRLMNPHIYHVSLSRKLWELKQSMIKNLAGKASE